MASKKQFIILSAMGYSKDEIADMSEEVAWNTIAKNGGSENIGFHYGDLGKAEIKSKNWTETRDTGHYGTGTYFFGSQESPGAERYRATRPEHIVNFDNYNLYKPKDNKSAEKLHSALKRINKFDKIDEQLLDISTDDIFDEYIKLPYGDRKAYIKYLFKYNAMEDEMIKYDTDELYKEVKNTHDNLSDRAWEIQRTIWDLEDLSGENEKSIKEKIKKALNTNNDNIPSTEFIKSLGYEGIDVRNLNKDAQGLMGFDNSAFGSVIYDLRPESEIKKIKG